MQRPNNKKNNKFGCELPAQKVLAYKSPAPTMSKAYMELASMSSEDVMDTLNGPAPVAALQVAIPAPKAPLTMYRGFYGNELNYAAVCREVPWSGRDDEVGFFNQTNLIAKFSKYDIRPGFDLNSETMKVFIRRPNKGKDSTILSIGVEELPEVCLYIRDMLDKIDSKAQAGIIHLKPANFDRAKYVPEDPLAPEFWKLADTVYTISGDIRMRSIWLPGNGYKVVLNNGRNYSDPTWGTGPKIIMAKGEARAIVEKLDEVLARLNECE